MNSKLTMIFAFIGWFALLAQYYLMLENRVSSIGETTVRFFSFFTILLNLLVTVYFSYHAFKLKSQNRNLLDQPGFLTAITVYITIVGIVYQTILRQLWEPTGLQKIVDELLHSVMPICTILYWSLYENKSVVKWTQIPKWLVVPLIYLVYILIRGKSSGFYPYPFVNVSDLGLEKVLVNGFFIFFMFLVLSLLFLAIGKWIEKNRKQKYKA